MIYELTAEKAAAHLAGACTFRTVSSLDEESVDWSPFENFHKFLEETYPNVFREMEEIKIGRAGILLHLKGCGDGSKRPLLFMAHQDVVPEGDVSAWKYPPFGGVVAEGKIWGRGAWDCKSNLIGQMEAMEHICSSDWRPSFDIWLSYGYNEEVGSGAPEKSAAKKAADYFIQRGIHFEGVFDECGGMSLGEFEDVFGFICSIGVGEKGYADFEITRKDPGGHSRAPHRGTALYYIGRAICALEENQMPYRITDAMKLKMETLAPNFMDSRKKALFSDVEGNWDEIKGVLDNDPVLAASFRTTMAPTMSRAAARPNILPETASVTVNCRILPGDTVDSVRRHIEEVIPKGLEVTLLSGNDPSPVSEFGCHLTDCIVAACHKAYGDFTTVPNLVLGGTDAKYMYGLSRHVFRFTPFAPLRWQTMAHVVNEAVDVHAFGEGPKTYVEILKEYDVSVEAH